MTDLDPLLPSSVYLLVMHLNVIPTAQDRVRLAPSLSTWGGLNELLMLNQFSLDDLKKLLIYEVAGKHRQQVLMKLRSRMLTLQSQHIQYLIHHVCTPATGRTDSRTVVRAQDAHRVRRRARSRPKS